MKILIENWYLVIAAIAVVFVCGYGIYAFMKRPTDSQLRSIKEWLLYATTEAEKALGGGTGQLKLRYVYDMFLGKFPHLVKIISFDTFSWMVDDALSEMRHMLETNKAVSDYVKEE